MVRIERGRGPLLLFSDERRIGLEDFGKFQRNEVGSVKNFNVQMGLPEGHSVLMYYVANWIPYQASKKKNKDHAMWKHVHPTSTDFAWLPPELANAFCSDALKLDDSREYGAFHEVHLGMGHNFTPSLVIKDMFYLGETRSAEDFGIFNRMPPERLCLGCGVRSDETFSPLPPQNRSDLYKAAVRLMCLVLAEVPPDETEDERLLHWSETGTDTYPCNIVCAHRYYAGLFKQFLVTWNHQVNINS